MFESNSGNNTFKIFWHVFFLMCWWLFSVTAPNSPPVHMVYLPFDPITSGGNATSQLSVHNFTSFTHNPVPHSLYCSCIVNLHVISKYWGNCLKTTRGSQIPTVSTDMLLLIRCPVLRSTRLEESLPVNVTFRTMFTLCTHCLLRSVCV